MLLELLESNRYRKLFFVFLTSQRSCEKSNQDLLLSVSSVLPLSLDGNLWRIRNYLKNFLLREQNIPFLNMKTSLVFRFSSMFFAIFGSSCPLRYTVDQQSASRRLRPLPPPLRCDRGARSLFVVYIDPRTRPCHLLLISRHQAVDSIGEIHPQTIIYFTKLVFLVSIREPHCKRCEISWRIISVYPCKWGEPGRDGEIRGEPREIQCNFLVKKLVSETCHVVARCSQHPLPMMVACSTHDDFYQKLFSCFREENWTISWIQSVDLIANSISTRFYRSNGIVSLRLNEERRSSSAVKTVCRPWTASPARTHPVEGCTTRKRSRNGVSCVGAASCGPFAAWRNAAAPFQLTSPATSTPLISSPLSSRHDSSG